MRCEVSAETHAPRSMHRADSRPCVGDVILSPPCGGESPRSRAICSRGDERWSAVREGRSMVAEGRGRGAFLVRLDAHGLERGNEASRLPLIRRVAPPSPRLRGEEKRQVPRLRGEEKRQVPRLRGEGKRQATACGEKGSHNLMLEFASRREPSHLPTSFRKIPGRCFRGSCTNAALSRGVCGVARLATDTGPVAMQNVDAPTDQKS